MEFLEMLILEDVKLISFREYFYQLANENFVLKTMPKRCFDCAITTGFYADYEEELLKMPADIQDKVAAGWNCHNNCNRSCKGILESVEINRN